MNLLGRKILIRLFLFLFCFAGTASIGNAQQQREFDLSVELGANEWKAARLKNLVRDAELTISVNGIAPVSLLILSKNDYENYPLPSEPIFKTRSFDKLTFSVKIPESGNYFLLLDNNNALNPAKLKLHIKAEAPEPTEDKTSQLQISLNRFNQKLSQLFIYQPISITLQTCGTTGSFSNSQNVILCSEFISQLQDSLQDQQKTTDVLLFALFHEFGHLLMLQWDYPFFDNEELADEFATAMLMMLRQQERLNATIEFFVSNPTARELVSKIFHNDRHPLSVQRARNIRGWMTDKAKIGRWQLFLIPHLQTDVLKTLRKEAQSSRFQQAIDQELRQR